MTLLQTELRNRNGSAPAPGAVLRALAENREAQEKVHGWDFFNAGQSAERGARSATPGAGVLPNFGVRVQCKPTAPFQLLAALLIFWTATSAHAQRQTEPLGRGLIALRKSSTQVYLGWRMFATDPTDTGFNLYRASNGGAFTKLNGQPLTNTTDYVDSPTLTVSNAYFVVAVTNGVEQVPSPITGLAANAPTRQYLSVPLHAVTGGGAPPYDVKFCWVGDFDGDGEYDFLVDRLSTTVATNQFLQAFKRDGTFLWQMDMGYNSVNQYAIEPGASAISIGDKDNVTVFDLDGDGRAEVCVRTARGTILPDGTVITGPDDTTQYLSILDGLTGHELARATITNLWPADGPLNSRFGIMYCDGVRPSLLIEGENRNASQVFQRETMAYDFRNGQLTRRWFYTPPPNSNQSWGHQIRIADVNHDGIDDLIEVGSVKSGVNGQPLFDTELMHGDRFHTTDIDPDRPGLETFAIQQNNSSLLATALYEAATGKLIKKWYSPGITDVGRGIALDMDPNYRGCEMYSTQPGIFDRKGNQIFANNMWAPEGVWWDADLSRELEDGAGSGALNLVINKFDHNSGGAGRLYSIYNEGVHQAYGGRAAFWGDILGDWREELVLVANDYSEIRIYSTTIAATNRIYCLMQNPEYRCQATCKGYYQASCVDYFLGTGMEPSAPPPISDARLVWRGNADTNWGTGNTANWFTNNLWISNNTATVFNPGDTVLFDLTGSNGAPINLTGSIQPGWVMINSPKNYSFSGSGSLDGAMKFTKAGAGKLTFNGTNNYSGKTLIAEGSFVVNGALPNSPVTVRGGVWLDGRLGGTGVVGAPVSCEPGGGVSPGAGTNSPGTFTIASNLTLRNALSDFDLSDDATGVTKTNDLLIVTGNLTLLGTNTLTIRKLDATLPPGVYPLINYSGTLSGSLNNLTVAGLDGVPLALTNPPGQIALVIKSTRVPATLTWTGGQNGNAWDLATSSNFLNTASKDIFVPQDSVRFDDTSASNLTVTLSGTLLAASVAVDSTNNFTLAGSGAILGSASLTKSNTGTLTITALNNNFTGRTVVGGGTLVVSELDAVGFPSPLGNPPGGSTNLVLSGNATLRVTGESFTDRGMTLNAGTNSLEIFNAADQLTVAGQIVGAGALQKLGPGTLTLTTNNTYSGGLIIRNGLVSLGSVLGNQNGPGTGAVTLDNARLSMIDIQASENCAWPIYVPTNSTGRLDCDGRCTLSGALTGGGTFTVWIPYVRTDFNGNWAAFTGQIFATSDSAGGNFRCNNSAGYPLAKMNIGSTASFQNRVSGTPTISIGELSGAAGGAASGGTGNDGTAVNWSVGGLNTSATFAGNTYNNIGFIKVGTGTWTWTGTNISHTGQTTVNAGTLLINGNAASSTAPVTVGASGTLGGTGTIGGATTVNGKLSPGNNSIATLTFNNSVTLAASGTTFIEINKTTAAKDVLVVGGTLNFGGGLQVTNLSGTLTNGDSFQIFSAPSHGGTFTTVSLPTLATNLSWNTSALYTSGIIAIGGIAITNPPTTNTVLVWKGDGAANAWDTTTANWLDASNNPSFFTAGASVTFNDSGTNNVPVTLSGTLQPSALNVNAAKNFTFSGGGSIAGTNALIKSGAGNLTITTTNTYSGGTILSNGVVLPGSATANSSAFGTGALSFYGGTLEFNDWTGSSTPDYGGNTNALIIPTGQTGTIRVPQRFLSPGLSGPLSGGGTINLFVKYVRGDISGNWSAFTGTINVFNGSGAGVDDFRINHPAGFANARLALGTNVFMYSRTTGGAVIPIGEFSGQASATVSAGGGSSAGAQSAVTWRVGGLNTDATNAAAFVGTTALIKEGLGKWVLTGINTHTGATTVSNGTLLVHGSLGNSTVTVWGGTLGGNGTLAGPVSIRSGATLAPGASLGKLTVSNTVTLFTGSTTLIELSKTPNTNDVLKTTGLLTCAGNLIVTNISANAIASGDSFKMFDAASVSGTFNNITLPALANGLGWNTGALYTSGTISVVRTVPVAAWGQNDFGQALVLPNLTNTVAIAAGGYHNLALRNDGSVIAWGNNIDGQCNLPANLTNVVAIGAGGRHSLAARSDGTVAAWGANDAGQIAMPSGATNVVALAGGDSHSLALRGDGIVIGWGDDSWGQLEIPTDATNIIAIATGMHHSLALRADGIVIAWGDNLGPFGDYVGQADVPWDLNQVTTIAAGGFHSLAVKTDGSVVGWGDNSLGQISAPVGLTNVVTASGGSAHSLALRADGTFTAWGDNTYGQSAVDPTLTGVSAIAAGSYHSLALQGQFPAVPQLVNAEFRIQNSEFRITVPTVRGKPCILLYKNSLDDPGWNFANAVSGNGAQKTMTNTTASPPQRFYRIQVP